MNGAVEASYSGQTIRNKKQERKKTIATVKRNAIHQVATPSQVLKEEERNLSATTF